MARKPKPPRRKEVPWTITRITGTPAEYVGRVLARDADEAIKRAIEEFGITDEWQQKRLVARREQ